MQLMAHLFNNVDIPTEVAKSKDGKETVSEYTQWVASKGPSHNQLRITDYANRTNYIQIDFNRISKTNNSMTWQIKEQPFPSNDLNSQLIE